MSIVYTFFDGDHRTPGNLKKAIWSVHSIHKYPEQVLETAPPRLCGPHSTSTAQTWHSHDAALSRVPLTQRCSDTANDQNEIDMAPPCGPFPQAPSRDFPSDSEWKAWKKLWPSIPLPVPCSWLGIHKCYLDPSWLNVSQRSSQQGVIAAQMFQHLCKTLDIWTAAYSLAVDQSSHSRSAFIYGISGALTGSCSNGSFKGSLEVITQKNSMVPSLLTHPDNICIDTQLNCICI